MKTLFVLKDKDVDSLDIATPIWNGGRDIGFILMLDAVYLATNRGERADTINDLIISGVNFYLLDRDIERRGLGKMLLKGIEVINYDELVDLLFKGYCVLNL
jgi:sulfur relay protein TusB/DsrH